MKELYDLTNPQKSIWVTEEFYKGTSIENIAGTAVFSQEVNFDKLNEAINIFVKTNDSFRLKFIKDNGNIKQFIDDFSPFSFDTINVSTDKDIKKIEDELSKTPLQIINSYLFNLKFFKFENGHGGFVIVMHHLIVDAWAAGLVISRIIDIYDALLSNTFALENFSNPSYTEYISSEQKYLESNKFEKDKTFWNDIFKTIPETATFPTLTQNKELSSKAKRKTFKIPRETMDFVNSFCKENKISPFNFFMGVYSIYLSRVSNLDEFVIGTPILNRANVKEKHTVGMFISVVPFKVTLNHDNSFAEFVSNISADFFNIFRHQKYPYQTLLEDLRKQNSSTPNLYNVMYSYQNMRSNKQSTKTDYESKWLFNGNISDDMEIHYFDINDTGIINVAYDYKTSKYSSEDIYAIHSRILHIINQIIENNNILLKDIEIVTPDEKNKILYDFNNTKMDYPKDKTIVQLFEEQVEKNPDNIAVVFEDQKLTYRELNEKANSLAFYLSNQKISRNDVVAIHLQKNIEYVISIIATLKCGATFLPISTMHPKNRIEFILNNSNSKILISNSSLINGLSYYCKYLDISLFKYNLSQSVFVQKRSSDIAYILYTSGSTGNPKGVKVCNYSVINHIYGINKKFNNQITSQDITLSIANISFDAHLQEIFIPILLGATLHLLPDNSIYNLKFLSNYIIYNNITFTFLPPNILEDICKLLSNYDKICLNKLLVGVESISYSTLNKFILLNKNIQIHNGYGPTEATICCVSYMYNKENQISSNSFLPIGTPSANTFIGIINPATAKLQPYNTIGEIIIGGDCVSSGYTDKSLNKAFIYNTDFNTVCYHTGDYGYFLNDGNIVFAGRIDNQVKINGHRIELQEIDKVIQSYSTVIKSISLIKNKKINTFVKTNEKTDINNLKNYIKSYLPYYMVPSKIIEISEIPMTINGKVDTKKLISESSIESNTQVEKPQTDIENKLFDIYSKVLNITNFGINDDFFDLGGDSLMAIRLSIEISNSFNIDINVQEIFDNNTIKKIAQILDTSSKTCKPSYLPRVENHSYYPTSSAQKRMYFASTMAGESVLYNIPGGIILDGEFDIKKLEKCFNDLISRHEAMRTYFAFENDNVVQKIAEKIDFKLDIQENIDFNELNLKFKDFVKPFDLSHAPLFRAKFINFNNKKSALFVDMHHIISDGTSLAIFIDELCKLYNDEDLSELNITYKDFAIFENNNLNSGNMQEAEKYWTSQFEENIPILNLPTNYTRPAVQSFDGAKIYSSIDFETKQKIEILSKNLGVTPYMILLSAYYILLSKYTAQEDIVVGSPIVGRDLSETYNLIGMFVNTLALRTKINSTSSFKEFLETVKNNCLNAYKYQTYPFDELVNKLNLKRDSSRNPLFDTMFTYQNNGLKNISLKNVNAEYYIPDTNISKFDLSIELIPNDDGISVSFEYATKLFNEDFIRNLSNHYLNILNIILENNEIKLADICMLSEAEKNTILNDFNNQKIDYDKNLNVVQIFEEQVEKNPDNIAVIFENEKLTYRELNAKANSIAHFLKQKDIGKNDIVPVFMNRSIELIITILGIIKAGAAYLPIAVETPAERIDFILQNSKAKIVFIKSSQNLIYNESIKIVDIEQFDYSKYSTKNINVEIKPSDLLYVIYTSGSTGNPKGVKVCHHNLVNFTKSFNEQYSGISCDDKLLASTNISFDVSIFEFFMTLLNGTKLYLYNEPNVNDIFKYCKTIIREKITFLYIPPNILEDVYSILSTYSNIPINKMLLGVEPIKSSTIKKYYTLNPDMIIINAYGPTEATICSTSVCLNSDILKQYKIIPIGRPLHNLQIYILDKNRQPVPIGVPGEIYISGDNVAKGYLNNKELTDKNFVSLPGLNCKLAYKTGDLAKWSHDGLISFIGRNDYQVKVNGHRIELGEIESCLYLYPNIDKALVLLDKNNKLICYFSSSKQININDLKAFMQRKLPLYFIPNFFVQVEKFKLTANGKIDRKALAKIKIDSNSSYEEPTTPYQKNLAEAFQTVLGIDKVGITDNFFELGGDSLLAIKLQIEAFNKGLELSYKDIFKYPTIKLLSENISSTKPKKDSEEDDYDYTQINELIRKNIFNNKDRIQKNKFKNVLLTGSTGYLGSHILDALLKNTKCNIYCLIRAKDNNDPQIRLLNTLRFYFGNKYDRQIFNRIIVIEGDIKDEKLGLNDLYYEELGATIDLVINSAAIVKHYGNMDTFNATNIQGAKNIIKFCSDSNCKLYHLSTLSVSGNIFETDSYKVAELSNDITFNEQSLYIGQDLSNVYIYTKFIAERLILEHIINGSLDAKIIRLGNITNRYSDGIFQINVTENAFINRMNSFLHIGYVPDYLADREIEFSPVDLCAEAIVKLIRTKNNFTIYHIYNNNHITFRELFSILKSLKLDINIVDKETFNKKIRALSKESNSKNILSGIINDFDENKNLVYNTNIKIQNKFTNKLLKNLSFKWPKINERYMKKYIIYLKSIGYIK